MYETVDRDRGRIKSRDESRSQRRDDSGSERREAKWSHYSDREEPSHRGVSHSHDKEYDEKYGQKRNRYEGSRTPGRSDWDDGRWEWEDTPRRDNRSYSIRHHQPSPSPMLVGESPDGRLVSSWLGGHTPHSAEPAASPWDSVPPSPVPIPASGSSVRSSSS
ncbi:unnamed protein product [Ilex paraguariensis]|uniref:Uncharacterized protein n=1 Tax=Ilex paraguariensis TaxID=185542 RepID=A0ABC8RQL1_9AQUA